jgi:hypothetical protein
MERSGCQLRGAERTFLDRSESWETLLECEIFGLPEISINR